MAPKTRHAGAQTNRKKVGARARRMIGLTHHAGHKKMTPTEKKAYYKKLGQG